MAGTSQPSKLTPGSQYLCCSPAVRSEVKKEALHSKKPFEPKQNGIKAALNGPPETAAPRYKSQFSPSSSMAVILPNNPWL